jgi:AraC-like DNA-binding protein
MTATPLEPRYLSTHIRDFDPDKFLDVIKGGSFDHYLVSPSTCHAEFEHWECDGVSIDRGHYSFPVIARGHFNPHAVCIGWSTSPAAPPRVNGIDISPSDIQVQAENAELDYKADAGTRWTAMQVARYPLQHAALRRLGRPLDLPARSLANLRAYPADVACLSNVVDSILTEHRATPHSPRHGRLCAGLLIDALVDAIGARRAALDDQARITWNHHRWRTVRAAQSWLQARIGEPFDVAALCQAVDLAERTLQLYFRQTLGMSPRAWHRCIALHEARRLLLATPPARTSVTSIAMRCGFNHLGRFATTYHELFGETPSTTLHDRTANKPIPTRHNLVSLS